MCKKHPKYKAVLRPRVLCEDCWRMYIENHPTYLNYIPNPKPSPRNLIIDEASQKIVDYGNY